MEKVKKNGRATVAVVTLGTFMSSFDISVVNMALPFMQSHFHASIASIEWVIVAYLLVLSATQLTFGRLSDMLGYKKLYVLGFALFTVSSLSCALAPSLAALIVFRVLQAISASMLSSSSSPIIVGAVEDKNRGKSLGMQAVAVAVSTCLGPALGGFLASTAGWNSIFLVNVPIGLIGTLFAIKIIRAEEISHKESRFDTLGSILIIISLFSILLPLNLLSKSARISPQIVFLFVLGAAALAAFIFAEAKNTQPLLELGLFKNRVFTASNFAAMFFYMAEFILVFAAPYYFQRLRGESGVMSGLMMLPMSAAMMAGAPISGAISDKFDSRYISCAGLALMTGSLIAFSFFGASTPVVFILADLLFFGFGGGLFQTPNVSAVMGSVPSNRRGVASATLGTMRNVGMVSGEAFSGAVICVVMSAFSVAAEGKGLSGAACFSFEFAPSIKIIGIAAAVCAAAAFVLTTFRAQAKKQ